MLLAKKSEVVAAHAQIKWCSFFLCVKFAAEFWKYGKLANNMFRRNIFASRNKFAVHVTPEHSEV